MQEPECSGQRQAEGNPEETKPEIKCQGEFLMGKYHFGL
jgi:hypothetical protein